VNKNFIVLAVLAAAVLRLPDLARRPMHADEAILADKTGTLLEKGTYAYDPSAYHGPALHYAAVPVAIAAGARTYVALNETVVRLVPALFGILLVASPLLLAGGLERGAFTAAAFFAAVSPAMVFYSRYYIPETLLVCFTAGAIGCAYRYACSRKAAWAVAAGICMAMMYATKETAIISFAAMAIAFAGEWRRTRLRWLVAAAVAGLVTAGLLLTSFLATYVRQAFHGPHHLHPWHYYLSLACRTEAVILLFAAVGLVIALRRPGLPRFLAVYTLLMAAFYSALPYKTPWCMLGVLHGLTLLAGIGFATMGKARLVAAAGFLVLAVLARSSYTESVYAYSQTLPDVHKVQARLEEIALSQPGGKSFLIQVFTRENFWPLPWYLRSFPNVQWWNAVPEKAPMAKVILASPEMEPALARRLYESPPPGQRELYRNLLDEAVYLRPGVELRGYVANSIAQRSK
jgi:predicted membrane-bound mannosyltransferase